jgi:hypothetical protein
LSTSGTCLMCSAPAPGAPCCSTDCLRAASRERDHNLREVRQLRGHGGSAELIAELTQRNGELTGALVRGLHPLKTPPLRP